MTPAVRRFFIGVGVIIYIDLAVFGGEKKD